MPALAFMVAALGAWYFGLFDRDSYTYRAEVGYYEGNYQQWFVGNDKTRDECQAEAISRFNSINARDPSRAFSWACRKMKGERFLERVR
jgi:hypothetical protein